MACRHHNPGTRRPVTLFKWIEPGYAPVMRRLALLIGLLPGQAVSALTVPERQDRRLQLTGEEWLLTVLGGGGHSSRTVDVGPDGRLSLPPGITGI